jgi:hypothetical protein
VFPVQISSLSQTILNGFAEWQDEIFSESKLKKIYQSSVNKYLTNFSQKKIKENLSKQSFINISVIHFYKSEIN